MSMNLTDNDTLQRFLFEKHSVRGMIIHLKATYSKACEHTEYDSLAKKYLGQALCSVGLLSSIIKYEGRLTLQLQSEGALKLLLAQTDENLHLRGLIKANQLATTNLLKATNDKGHLLINIDPKSAKDRYQAITELKGENLADTLEHYFRQSEQLPTRLWLFTNEDQAAGLLLQKIPGKESDNTFWEHVTTLAETITAEELLGLTNQEIIHRLFHEEDVRLFEREPVSFKCNCSIEKMEDIIYQLGQKEAESLLAEHALIVAHCDFCNKVYNFDKVDVARIFSSGTKVNATETKQ